jgi:hypothetical protein
VAATGWDLAGGTFGVGLVYEYRDDDGRAYVVGDEHGRATIVTFDLDTGAEKGRVELECALRRDPDALLIGTSARTVRRLES